MPTKVEKKTVNSKELEIDKKGGIYISKEKLLKIKIIREKLGEKAQSIQKHMNEIQELLIKDNSSLKNL